MMQATTAVMLHDPDGVFPCISVLLRYVRFEGNVWLYVVPGQDNCDRCGELVRVRLNNAGTHVACSCTGGQWRTITAREAFGATTVPQCSECKGYVLFQRVEGEGVRVLCSCTTAPDIPLDDTDEGTETTEQTSIVTPLKTNSNATQQHAMDRARKYRGSVVLRNPVGYSARAKAYRERKREVGRT
jgi:hypothetical protein